MDRPIFFIISFLSLCIVSMPLFAWESDEKEAAMHLTPNLENGKRIYQEICTTCHDDTGWADGSDIARQFEPGFFPQIASQHKNVIIKQLADIRDGNRDNPIMYPFTLGKYIGGPQDIADVSAYVASLKPNLNNNIGNGFDLELGADLYRVHCQKCHGKYGEGDNEKFYPKIQGQHYNYLLRQFVWIRDGRRRNANTKMRRQIARFTFREMMAVIDYVSRLKPPPENQEASKGKTPEKNKQGNNGLVMQDNTKKK